MKMLCIIAVSLERQGYRSLREAHVAGAVGRIAVLVLIVQPLQRGAVQRVAGVHVRPPRLAAQVACRGVTAS